MKTWKMCAGVSDKSQEHINLLTGKCNVTHNRVD